MSHRDNKRYKTRKSKRKCFRIIKVKKPAVLKFVSKLPL
jgi:hypothetical protein